MPQLYRESSLSLLMKLAAAAFDFGNFVQVAFEPTPFDGALIRLERTNLRMQAVFTRDELIHPLQEAIVKKKLLIVYKKYAKKFPELQKPKEKGTEG